MGADPSVVVNAEVVNPTSAVTHLQRAMFTFVPSTAPFLAGFQAAAQFGTPGDRIGAVLTRNDYVTLLEGWGAAEDEPVRQALDAFFGPRAAPDAQGLRGTVIIADRVYIGRRTRAEVTQWSLQLLAPDPPPAGTITVTVCPKGEGPGTQRTFTFLAQEVVAYDGVDLLTVIRDNIVAALNANADFSAVALAAPVGGDTLTITTLAEGFPLIVTVEVSVGGVNFALTKVSNHVATSWSNDLDDINRAIEDEGEQARSYYWLHDLQWDDDVNEEAFAYMTTLAQDPANPQAYQYHGQSYNQLNFDPLAAGTSPAEIANAAKYARASVMDHSTPRQLCEFLVAALYGRTTAYLPGEINFSDRVLNGSNANAIISKQDPGLNEPLATTRFFNFYSAEGPSGSSKWGYLASSATGNPRFIDQTWLEDYTEFVATVALIQFKQVRNIVSYTDVDIQAGVGVLTRVVAAIPAIIADSVIVTFKKRTEVDPQLIIERTYVDYIVSATAAGAINRFGTQSQPISITIQNV